eukprot:scaffold59948_cov60-Phaeocystis_antarctica.AAC.5
MCQAHTYSFTKNVAGARHVSSLCIIHTVHTHTQGQGPRVVQLVHARRPEALTLYLHTHTRVCGPPSTNLPKEERDERRHAKAIHAWQSGAHQLGGTAGVAGGALDAVELEDESSDGGGGVATALPGRRRSALSKRPLAAGGGRGGGGGGRDATGALKTGIVVGRVSYLHISCWYLYYGANATENITLLRTLAGPGSTGVNGRLRSIR